MAYILDKKPEVFAAFGKGENLVFQTVVGVLSVVKFSGIFGFFTDFGSGITERHLVTSIFLESHCFILHGKPEVLSMEGLLL